MTAKVFVDSNILIYAYDLDAGVRRHKAGEALERLWAARSGTLSTQVLQEFYVNVTRKINRPLSKSSAREIVRSYAPWVGSSLTPETIVRASEISEIWRLSFWDSMILAAAEQDGASELLSEDLTHGQSIAGVKVVNPFM